MEKQTKTDYGRFARGGSEYTVSEVNTPLPLVNYFWNEHFISGVSQHMAGIGCFSERPMQYMHPECRCLMIRGENRHFYLRDHDSGAFWSPGWYPVGQALEEYQCHHGLGYSLLESGFAHIKAKLRVFVPSDTPVEIWTITLENTGALKRSIKLYSFVDWLLTGYEENADYHSCLRSEYRKDINLLMCFNEAFERPHEWFNGFIASSVPATGFDSSRRAFLGYGQINRPPAVVEGRCSNSLGVCEKLVGVLEHTFILEPEESATLNIIIGASDSMQRAEQWCKTYFEPPGVEPAYQQVVERIDELYQRVHIETPEEKINYLFNHWIKRAVQLHTEVGTTTVKGLRDILQAAWAVGSYDAPAARQKIVDALTHQYADGHTLRGWDPLNTHHYSDGPVWMAPAVDAYLKETRDYGFLELVVPYFDGGQATVWEHLLTGIRHATEDLGPHGLIKAHDGDWNDSLNGMGSGGIGESNWTSIAMIFSIDRALEIADHVLADHQVMKELQERAEKLRAAIHRFGWDGGWYLEGINDAGEEVGSHKEREGYVYLNPQTWAILAGITDREKLARILEVIDKQLECDYGSLVLYPAYRKPNRGIGRITWFVPGMWENASPYCHGTAFKIVADTYVKRGNKAYESLLKVLPDHKANPSSHSGCPPYMVTNMYYGPEHPRKGQILYSWITGTADWLFKAVTGHMIGVRAEYRGLLIDPCVPAHWKAFSIRRDFMGSSYGIDFFNPQGKQSGVSLIELDGRPLEGNVLPVFGDGKTHRIKVVM